jgi:hypothetical protein
MKTPRGRLSCRIPGEDVRPAGRRAAAAAGHHRITSNPALAHYDGKTYIGVGSAIWFPQIIEYDNGDLNVRTFMSAPGFNALAHGSFGSLTGDGQLHYVLPSPAPWTRSTTGFPC